MNGRLLDPKSLLFRVKVGTVSTGDVVAYDLALAPDNKPVITSRASGVSWCISWSELVAMAQAAGIDQPWSAE